ncbi:MAG TPA: BsuPI-related putative proteinase inhibitor [Gemmatimonadaceae bacterium]|jgi:hypothetical protein|nr:BsuPI-related putative proteinase inhibitor [Gemmatimonadaceae bacterium]
MVRQLCVGTLLVIGVACSDDLTGFDRAMGLVLETSVSSESIEQGQVDTITVTLTNTTSSTISLTFGSGCQFRVFITDMFDHIVVPPGGGWACTQALTGRTIPPHQAQSVQFEWAGSTNFSPDTRAGRLPPGLYRVFATLDAYEVNLTTDRVPIRLR